MRYMVIQSRDEAIWEALDVVEYDYVLSEGNTVYEALAGCSSDRSGELSVWDNDENRWART